GDDCYRTAIVHAPSCSSLTVQNRLMRPRRCKAVAARLLARFQGFEGIAIIEAVRTDDTEDLVALAC
ncbi:MAG TPA: hypothetical protein VIK60_18200, partial [Vicinamibacterales bacterium]